MLWLIKPTPPLTRLSWAFAVTAFPPFGVDTSATPVGQYPAGGGFIHDTL